MLINQDKLIQQLKEYTSKMEVVDEKKTRMFANTFIDTISNTVTVDNDKVFIATGDIPAMWLRDSTFQVLPYLNVVQDIPEVVNLIHGVINQQLDYINHDPYANAFNQSATGAHYNDDFSNIKVSDLVWERKFEIDSLCAPLFLVAKLYEDANYKEHITDDFWKTLNLIVNTFITEQHHENSEYIFKRDIGPKTDTLSNGGKGSKFKYTGMVWSGFRPSDDACQYNYFIPGNMFIVVVLEKILALMERENIKINKLYKKMLKLTTEIKKGIAQYGIVANAEGQKIYAYEVDGLGNANFMDDANVPSLLSIPFIGYVGENDCVYKATRKFILSKENPYYYRGKYLEGIGSPHTPKEYVWPISLAMEGLSSKDVNIVESKLKVISETDNNTRQCHEGIYVNDPSKYTREWFSWANMTYCQLAFHYLNLRKT